MDENRIVFCSLAGDVDYGLTVVNERVCTDEAVKILEGMKDVVYFDSEAAGRNAFTDKIVAMQFFDGKTMLLVYTNYMPITPFKEAIESKKLVIQNSKNDLLFLYVNGIFPLVVFCTMLQERLLSCFDDECKADLQTLARKYANVVIDKSLKGKITYEVTDESVQYLINDVKFLPDIFSAQETEIKKRGITTLTGLENRFSAALAYFEYCGVRISPDEWEKVIQGNETAKKEADAALDEFIYENFSNDKKLCSIDMQGDLFEGFKYTKKCFVKWNSDISVNMVMDKCSEEQKSVLRSAIAKYVVASNALKVYGKTYITSATNGRVHSIYRQSGITGRISCPQKGINKYGNEVPLVSVMGFPKDGNYRNSVTAEEGNILLGADWSSQELYILAVESGEKDAIEFSNGDLHGYVFNKAWECSGKDSEVYEKLRPHMKQVNLGVFYLMEDAGLADMYGITPEQAKNLIKGYSEAFPKIAGYIKSNTTNAELKDKLNLYPSIGFKVVNKDTGKLKSISEMISQPGFWKQYSKIKASDPSSIIVKDVKLYYAKKNKLSRFMANAPMQCRGAMCFKLACIHLFNRIKKEGLIGKVLMCIPQHDAIIIECPESMKEKCKDMLRESMNAASKALFKIAIPIKMWESKHWR